MPGSGRLLITGYSKPDLEASDEMSGSLAKGATRNALMQAIHWLYKEQDSEWFQRLPAGPRRLDLKRRVLMYGEQKTRAGRATRGATKEELVDIFIHTPQNRGTWSMGLAICVALAESMRGCRTKLRAMYAGGVELCGRLHPLYAREERITRDDFDVLITTEIPGQQRLGFPCSAPAGLSMLGFAHAREVLEYIMQEDHLLAPPQQQGD